MMPDVRYARIERADGSLLAETGAEPIGKVVIGTVKGDIHDIGKDIVVTMLDIAGFDVVDLGVDVKIDAFIATAKEKDAQIIAMSCLLTSAIDAMKSVVAGSRSRTFSAKSVPSTLETKRNARSRAL